MRARLPGLRAPGLTAARARAAGRRRPRLSIDAGYRACPFPASVDANGAKHPRLVSTGPTRTVDNRRPELTSTTTVPAVEEPPRAMPSGRLTLTEPDVPYHQQ